MALPVRNVRIRLSQGQLFWREVGQGKTVVFLHGAWSEGDEWLPLIQALSAKYHCVAPDLLGFGESERPRRRFHYSIAQQTECLQELLEVLRLGPVILVGHGLGGWIATSFALQHPDQVQSLVLIAPEGVQPRELAGRWTAAWWLTRRPPVLYWVLKGLLPLARLLGAQGIDQVLRQRRRWMRSPIGCKLLFNRRASDIRRELVQDQLDWLKLPVLLLQGDRAANTTAILTRAYGKAPQARVQLLAGGDDLLDTSVEAIAQAMQAFLNDRHTPPPDSASN